MKKASIIIALAVGFLGSISLALADSNQTESQDMKSHSMMQDNQSQGDEGKPNNMMGMMNMMNMMSKMEPMMKQCSEMMETMNDHMKSGKDA
tara:strand:- start:473 stop:748 length:276 start_codon:yes stop_codon:yes gene_type:complete